MSTLESYSSVSMKHPLTVRCRSFTIKKLQDAYDCDLDLSDTVGAIYEGESDAQMRTIKVVPSFVNRDFSMPVTSNLRPGSAQKRLREITEGPSSKRRRLEEEQRELMDVDPSRDRPVASTESEHSGDENTRRSGTRITREERLNRRSESGGSLVFVQNAQTGNEEFGTQVKEESPELGLPPIRIIPESPAQPFKKPALPASKMAPSGRRHTRSPRKTPNLVPNELRDSQSREREQDQEDATERAIEHQIEEDGLRFPPSPSDDVEEEAIDESPNSTPHEVETLGSQSTERRNIRGTPSTPPWMSTQGKTQKTYGRSFITPNHVQQATDLLNSFRSHSGSAKDNVSEQKQTLSGKARHFQKPEQDEIESTPDEVVVSAALDDTRFPDVHTSIDKAGNVANGTHVQDRTVSPRPSTNGKLRKPTRIGYKMPILTQNLGVKITKKANQTPSTGRRRNATGNITPLSTSTGLSNASGESPTASTGTSDLRRDQPRRTSPKVVIATRSLAQITRASPGLDIARRGSSSHSAADTNSLKPNTREMVNDASQDEESVPNVTTPTLVNGITAAKPPIPRKTPVPLPRNNLHLTQTVGAAPLDDSTRPKKLAATSQVASAKIRPKKKAFGEGNVETGVGTEETKSNDKLYPRYKSDHLTVLNARNSPSFERSTTGDGLRTKTKVPIPENVRHLFPSASVETESSGDNTTKSYIVEPASQALKRRGRPPKGAGLDQTTKIEEQPSTTASKHAKSASSAIGAHSAPRREMDDAIVLSSGGSSSDESDSEEDMAEVPVDPITEVESPRSTGISPSKVNITSSTEKKHNGIMKKMFEHGDHERTRKERDPTRLVFGDVPEDHVPSTSQKALSIVGDAEFLLDAEVEEQIRSENLQSQVGAATAESSRAASEKPQSRLESPQSLRNDAQQSAQEATPSNRPPWNSQSWGFGDIDQGNDGPEKAHGEIATDSRSDSPSEHEGTTESELDPDTVARSKSKSTIDSTRSSPAVERRPARFLSRSPTPENSSSDEESVTSRSPSQSRVAALDAASEDADTPSDDSSNDSEPSDASEAEAEDEDTDVEMADAEKKLSPVIVADPPSSPPALPASQPITSIPRAQSSQLRSSQSLPRDSQLPFKTNTPSMSASQPTPTFLGSSQSISRLANARRATYSKFPSIKQQLTAARANTASKQPNKKFDPRTSNLGKLATKKGKTYNVSDSDSEDDSSQSSSSDSDGGKTLGKKQTKKQNGASCLTS